MLGAYCLLCYGIAVCGPFDGFCPYVFRYGSVECTDCFLDFSHYASLTLKPLWSPFLEMFKTKKYFVVATEIITGLAFALVALSLPLPDFFVMPSL